ncbi:hypothetical protein ACFL26_02220 [Patescibacteria group bacterium]
MQRFTFDDRPSLVEVIVPDGYGQEAALQLLDSYGSVRHEALEAAPEVTGPRIDAYVGRVIGALRQVAGRYSPAVRNVDRSMFRVVEPRRFEEAVGCSHTAGRNMNWRVYVKGCTDLSDNEQLIHGLIYALAHEAVHLAAGRRLTVEEGDRRGLRFRLEQGLSFYEDGMLYCSAFDEGMTDIIARDVAVETVRGFGLPSEMEEVVVASLLMTLSLPALFVHAAFGAWAARLGKGDGFFERSLAAARLDYFRCGSDILAALRTGVPEVYGLVALTGDAPEAVESAARSCREIAGYEH